MKIKATKKELLADTLKAEGKAAERLEQLSVLIGESNKMYRRYEDFKPDHGQIIEVKSKVMRQAAPPYSGDGRPEITYDETSIPCTWGRDDFTSYGCDDDDLWRPEQEV